MREHQTTQLQPMISPTEPTGALETKFLLQYGGVSVAVILALVIFVAVSLEQLTKLIKTLR
jgi:hypothetical protein